VQKIKKHETQILNYDGGLKDNENCLCFELLLELKCSSFAKQNGIWPVKILAPLIPNGSLLERLKNKGDPASSCSHHENGWWYSVQYKTIFVYWKTDKLQFKNMPTDILKVKVKIT